MPSIAITALTDPVAIVHIPVHLTSTLTTKVYWTIDRASTDSPEFFNLTSNRIEIAIFASLDLVMQEWADNSDPEVLISTTWRVFEISSGDEGDAKNYDSPHLRHVSSPLARAGISILYQSSYFTDFLLVKQEDFERTARIFAAQGWRVDPTSSPLPNRRKSQLLSPLSPTTASPIGPSTRASPPLPSQPEITVLPPALACVGFSRTAEQRSSERVRKFLVWPERASVEERRKEERDEPFIYDETQESESEVSENLPTSATLMGRARACERPFISYTRNEDGASLVTEIKVLRSLFPPGGEEGLDMDLQSGGELWNAEGEHDDLAIECRSEEGSDDEEFYTPQYDEARWTPPPMSNGQTQTPPPDSHQQRYGRYVCGRHSLPPTPGVERDLPLFGEGEVMEDEDEDEEEEIIPIRWGGPTSTQLRPRSVKGESGSPGSGTGTGTGSGAGKKRCLQLDLRGVGDGDEGAAYHLEKSGLVTRFSDLLTSSPSRPIRILYSSTFHTANILVEDGDVKLAKRLLERKRRSGEWGTRSI